MTESEFYKLVAYHTNEMLGVLWHEFDGDDSFRKFDDHHYFEIVHTLERGVQQIEAIQIEADLLRQFLESYPFDDAERLSFADRIKIRRVLAVLDGAAWDGVA